MNEVIAASKNKCKVCKTPIATIVLVSAGRRGVKHVIDKAPAPDGGIVITVPGLIGDSKSPAGGVFVGAKRLAGGERYRTHVCKEKI